METGLMMVGAFLGIPMIILAAYAIWWRSQNKVDAEIVSIEPKHYGLQTRYVLTYRYVGEDGEAHEGKAVHKWQTSKNTLPVLVRKDNPKKCMPVENWRGYAVGAGVLFVMLLLALLVPLLYRSPF